eukprot:354539-Chlamydomonas_euryale.AAC.2
MTLTLAPHPTARPQESCNMMVHGDLSGDWLRDYSLLLPEMLEDGVRVMIYAGDLDLICNWLGNARWVDGLEWAGAEQWAAAPEAEWSAGGGTAGGTVRSAAGLSFVKVYQAGHMVREGVGMGVWGEGCAQRLSCHSSRSTRPATW